MIIIKICLITLLIYLNIKAFSNIVTKSKDQRKDEFEDVIRKITSEGYVGNVVATSLISIFSIFYINMWITIGTALGGIILLWSSLIAILTVVGFFRFLAHLKGREYSPSSLGLLTHPINVAIMIYYVFSIVF